MGKVFIREGVTMDFMTTGQIIDSKKKLEKASSILELLEKCDGRISVVNQWLNPVHPFYYEWRNDALKKIDTLKRAKERLTQSYHKTIESL